METKAKWYTKTVWIAVLLILFFPAGLFLMWKYSDWKKITKWIVTIFFGLVLLGSLSSPKTTELKSITKTPTPTQKTVKVETKTTTTLTPTIKPTTSTQKEIQKNIPSSNETISQRNAVKKAKSYLNYTAFSHDGLVAQLEYEQFSHEDSVYGADNSGANWMDQAAKKAKAYMEYSAFSRGSLIEQLKYEKFTQEQAEYGANAVGL